MQSTNIIKTISFIGAIALAVIPARAVSPPPDGGYANDNTAEGEDTLFSLTTGFYNTAVGSNALFSNTDGYGNTANGAFALQSNTTGGSNTASGSQALTANTTGGGNTASGSGAMASNTTGGDNTATGFEALAFNTEGNFNTATGLQALYSNTTGGVNTANGYQALYSNTTGGFNSAGGYQALYFNTTGNNNTAIGYFALVANTTGNSNIALGFNAGINLTTGSNNIDIGNAGVAGESNKIRIGTKPAQKAAFIAGISGVTVANGVGVIINPQGQLGTVVSSARYKEAIKPMDKASEAILALQPVTFRYKHELDPVGIPQFGLVAEQVEKVNPDLVARDDQGKPYTVRYEAVNAMLLNEFLKAHRKLEEQTATIAEVRSTAARQDETISRLEAVVALQQKEIGTLTVSLKQQASEIQNVARLRRVEVSKPAPRVVANN